MYIHKNIKHKDITNLTNTGQNWQKNEKKEKNTDHCKALCVSHKCKNIAILDEEKEKVNKNISQVFYRSNYSQLYN